jgi:hypothetical protein
MGLTGSGGSTIVRRTAPALGLLAALGLSLMPAPADATRSPTTATAVSSRARHRALQAYRRHRALSAHRPHRRRDGVHRARAAVVGGAEAAIEQTPWQAAVLAEFEVEGEKGALLCGGSIIDTTHVVTAAHCAFNPLTEKPLTAGSFVVLAGASSLTEAEVSKGPTVQARFVAQVRIHPYFNHGVGAGAPDDVAVLELAKALTASSAVKPIGLPSSASAPPEGTDVVLSGYGEENPATEELNEKLYSLGMTLVFPRRCGGEADALFLCGSNTGGSACNGDSGGPVIAGTPSTLVGIVDIVDIVEGQRCRFGAVNGFVNLAAPEVRDFIEGDEAPPLAPRGGGVVIEGVIVAGHPLSCRPGSWSNRPAFIYAFINGANGQVLLQGPSPTYVLSEADVGRTILCQVQASNAGGTGIARTVALAPVKPAPPPPPPVGSPGGGVLGSTTASVGATQIQALLRRQLTPTGKAAKIAALLKTGGLTVTFQAPEPGTVAIAWYQLPAGAKLSNAKARPVLVASGQITFSKAGTLKIKLKLTAAGRRLLKHSKRLKLTASGKFTPPGETAVTATKVFVLRR